MLLWDDTQCFLLCLDLYDLFKKSQEVIEGHTFPELHPITATWTCEYQCNVQQHISIDKWCAIFKGHLLNMKGQFEVKDKVQSHIGL